MRRMLYTLVIVLAVLVAVGPTFAAEQQPDGVVKIQSGSIAAGIGWSWGSGSILFQGKENRFKVDGLTVGSVGFAMSDATGEAYNLKSLDQFAGTYTALTAGMTVGGGGSIMRLKNQNGVELVLKTRSQGINFQTAVDGVKIKME